MNWHYKLDFDYGSDGDSLLSGIDPNLFSINSIKNGETLLHIAARRRRLEALKILIAKGADLDLQNQNGKTAYAHAIRRGFFEISDVLQQAGASTGLTLADQLAILLSRKLWNQARQLLDQHPEIAKTGNPEEDRLLADMAGRSEIEPIHLLIDAGADVTIPGLDNGTPLHQAAWFGQPQNLGLLLEAGAPLEIFDQVHHSSPLGWGVHGSRYSGGAEIAQSRYEAVVNQLLEAGSSLFYPEDLTPSYYQRLWSDGTDRIRPILEEYWNKQ